MKHEEGQLKNIRGANIYWQSWLPENEPRAALLIVHGYDDHSGRYMNIVNHFVPKGFAVYGMDHPGHGKSEGTRGHIKKFEDYTETFKEFKKMVRDRQADIPFFLIGFSMGAIISSVYLLENQKEISGVVIIALGLTIPEYINEFTLFIGKIFSGILPKARISIFEDKDFCKDPRVMEAYNKDPLVYRGKITVRLAAEMLKSIIRLNSEVDHIALPVLILQGSEDKFVDPEDARKFYDLIQSKDKQIKIYEGLYHELFNEPEHEIVLEDMEEWLNKRI